MSLAVEKISPEQLDALMSLEEGHFVDLKRIEVKPAKLTRSISAFANADGGELYIGVGENHDKTVRFWAGFARMEDANGHLQAFEGLFPMGYGFEYEFLAADGQSGAVLHVYVAKSAEIKEASDGAAYLRRGSQNLPQNSEEQLHRLRLAKGLSSHENVTLSVDVEAVTDSLAVTGFMIEVVPEGDPAAWLKKQGLIVNGLPTVAAILLFGDIPQAHLPKAAIKIYRYQTDAAEGTRDTLTFDPIAIEGSIYDQIRDGVARVTSIIGEIQVMRADGMQPIEYPPETLHEIITNAVLHRDYSLSDDVHVRIFDNRVEVESPGRLPAHVTPSNILQERFARNASVVRIINKFPDAPNKDVGEGLNTAFTAMQKLRLREPEIRERDNSTLVVIRHESLASPETLIVQYLEKNKTINNSKARELTSIASEVQMRRVIQRMEKAGEIERVPGTQKGGSLYRRPT